MKKRAFILLFVLALSVLMMVSCSGREIEQGRALVEVNAKKSELTVTVMPSADALELNAKIYLFALAPGQTEDNVSSELPVASADAAERLTFTIPLFEKGISRLYHSFVAAYVDELGQYVSAIDAPAYVVNPEAFAENTSSYAESSTPKGINAEYDVDALELGVGNAVIEIPIESYLLATPSADALSHVYAGESFYLDRHAVETLDNRVKYYTDNRVNVYFRFVLKTSHEDLPAAISCLAYSADDGGSYYPINMTDSRSAAYVTALLDFMAERYTRADRLYGLCSNFIAGKALNGSEETSNQGSSSMLARIMYIAMASHYSNGRVFVTVDNNKSSTYSFLTEFARRAEAGGDYPWGIALSVRAASTESDRIWYDDSGNGKYITPSNIGNFVGKDFLGLENMLYEGDERRVMISDFSVELGDSEIAPELQSASIAYAYYKFCATDAIDAIIYSYQADTPTKRVGLRALDNEGNPAKTRRSWQIFHDVDSDADINSFVSQYIREASFWTPLYTENAAKVQIKRVVKGTAVLGVVADDYAPTLMFGFDDGTLQGFTAVGEGSYSGLVRVGSTSAFKAYLPKISVGESYVSRFGVTAAELNQNSLLVTICLEGEVENTTASSYRVGLTLVQSNGSGDVKYIAEVHGIAAGAPVTVAFDVAPFREAMKNGDVELRLSAKGDDGSGCFLRVDRVSSGRVQKNTWLILLLVFLAVLSLAAMVALAVIWYRKKRGAVKIKK